MIDYFSKYGFEVPLKNKVAQTIAKEFFNIFHNSNRKPKLFRTDDEKENVKEVHTELFNGSDIKRYGSCTNKRTVLLERFNRR